MGVQDVDALLTAAEPLIELAVAEDIGPGDATSDATLRHEPFLRGRVVSKSAGVIAGLPIMEAVFKRVIGSQMTFLAYVSDGQDVVAGELIAEVTGPGPALLAAERIALNFIQRMSGVATLTRAFVDAVATTDASILDTRKTLPGYRVLDKYAVRMGGGLNHRMSLYDMLLIKDNHIDAAGSLRAAVKRALAASPDLPIEVEVRDLDELLEALNIEPPLDRILLDNMSLDMMREAVAITDGRVPLEASGGVTLESVSEVAMTGVNYVSVGALTHSVPALDISMKVRLPADADNEPLHDMRGRLQEIKEALGKRLVVLGHHYQRDTVLEFADFRGDSLQLARNATETEAEFIVFCGVHFMAESAAILAHPGQRVLSPDPRAGCYLADTATLDAVQCAWGILAEAFEDIACEITPITYVNSSAALKAFCGQHGGAVCTSGNAADVLRWAFRQRPRVFFFPDQHLGRNTARQMGVGDEQMLLWDVSNPPGFDAIQRAKVVLWPGACNVHQRFRSEHVRAVRARDADARVIVHPECKADVVALADDAGSTAYIIKAIDAAPLGTHWAVGTETHLVRRLQREHPGQVIMSLADVPPFCSTMGQVTLENLVRLLESLLQGKMLNHVTVAPKTAHWAGLALEQMLML